MERLPLLVITGPTAAGKSELALRLAERLGGEILSADSAQVYRYLDIGTAKPSTAERRRVRHHLIDLIDPDRRFSVADFQRLADRAAADACARGNLPILVGGTGLYLRAVIQRFHFEPLDPDPELRRRLHERARAQGVPVLHRQLAQVDPAAAERIHPNDERRIVRALEVYLRTGRRISELQTAAPERSPYDAYILRLHVRRDRLYRRIDRRTRRQIASGWPDEVRLLAERFGASAPALTVLGYRELLAYVRGAVALDATVRLIQTNTRRYARRQFTWLRRERADRVLDVTGGITAALVEALGEVLRRRWQETSFR